MTGLEATEVRELLDEFEAEAVGDDIAFIETAEGFAEAVVEAGTYTPDARVHIDVSLTPRERLFGTRQQDVTGLLATGMMLGAALERDVPEGTDLEERWRNGDFVLPGAGESCPACSRTGPWRI